MLGAAPMDDRPVATNRKVTDSEGNEKEHISVEEVVVDRLNQLFGFNGWSSEIRDIKTDFVRLAMLRTYLWRDSNAQRRPI
jgi:hypothetical protein